MRMLVYLDRVGWLDGWMDGRMGRGLGLGLGLGLRSEDHVWFR